MKVLVSFNDSTSLKIVDLEKGTDTSNPDAVQPVLTPFILSDEPSRKMIYDSVNKNAIVYRKSKLEIYNYNSNDKETPLTLINKIDISVELFTVQIFDSKIYTITSDGKLTIFNSDLTDPIEFNLPLGPKESISAFQIYNSTIIAYGGPQTDLRVIQLPTKKEGKVIVKFKAKNLPNDRLDLSPKIHITQIHFINETELYTLTHFGQLRYYNTAEGRKPRTDVKISSGSIVKSEFLNGSDLIVADGTGETQLINPKGGSGKLLGKFKDSNGVMSTQSVIISRDNFALMGGSDRYIRIYNEREQWGKVYVSGKVSGIAILDAPEISQKKKQQEKGKGKFKITDKASDEENNVPVEEEDSEDEMWTKLEKAPVERRKRRKLF
ncbi:ribosome biosynthesis protein [Martiniozyma asiatica (nom. inval.)]|nr:ribosome biosynthesis protein [Martiniozyma asiatica]